MCCEPLYGSPRASVNCGCAPGSGTGSRLPHVARRRDNGGIPPEHTHTDPSMRNRRPEAAAPFVYQEMFPLGPDVTRYRKLDLRGVETIGAADRRFLRVAPETTRAPTRAAIRDISHLFRASHLQQLRNILDDPEASANDRFVALDLLKNAAIASGFVLPSCQDTGTAIVKAKKGQEVLVDGDDRAAISHGVHDA